MNEIKLGCDIKNKEKLLNKICQLKQFLKNIKEINSILETDEITQKDKNEILNYLNNLKKLKSINEIKNIIKKINRYIEITLRHQKAWEDYNELLKDLPKFTKDKMIKSNKKLCTIYDYISKELIPKQKKMKNNLQKYNEYNIDKINQFYTNIEDDYISPTIVNKALSIDTVDGFINYLEEYIL
jgi:predicted DNA-binding transcriptional regulator AlpA